MKLISCWAILIGIVIYTCCFFYYVDVSMNGRIAIWVGEFLLCLGTRLQYYVNKDN